MTPVEGASLTHLDAAGRATMVDVSAKEPTDRWARARAVVRMSPGAAARVAAGDAPKGLIPPVSQVKVLPISENLFLMRVPKNVTATIAAIAMKAMRMPYSARAAPSSSLTNLLAAALIRSTSASWGESTQG